MEPGRKGFEALLEHRSAQSAAGFCAENLESYRGSCSERQDRIVRGTNSVGSPAGAGIVLGPQPRD